MLDINEIRAMTAKAAGEQFQAGQEQEKASLPEIEQYILKAATNGDSNVDAPLALTPGQFTDGFLDAIARDLAGWVVTVYETRVHFDWSVQEGKV